MNNGYINSLFIVDTVTNESKAIQWVPKEIEYNPESDFVAISSPGRNNSFFHFGGSDDTLSLELDWHATQENREDVIENCRWLEALSKNQGREEGVHPVLLLWGNALFRDPSGQSAFLVTSAKYTLSAFSRPHQMYPTQAIQNLVLKRITTNSLTHEDIKLVMPSGYIPDANNPDLMAQNFQKTWGNNPAVFKRDINDTNGQDLRYLTPEYFNDKKVSRLQRIATSKGKELALSAANFLLNKPIGKATQVVGQKLSEIQTLELKLKR